MSAETTATPAPRSLSVRFSARDLLSTAVFAVILIVLTTVIGMLGAVSPLVWLLIVPVQALVGGIPVMLFLTRVHHAGMMALFSLVVALFYLLGGNTVLSTAAIVVLGLFAELVLWTTRYRSRVGAITACTVFSLSYVTPFLPLLIDRDAYFGGSSWTEMGPAYVRAADALLTVPALGLVSLAILVAGFLGALLGSALVRRHFVRAGLA